MTDKDDFSWSGLLALLGAVALALATSLKAESMRTPDGLYDYTKTYKIMVDKDGDRVLGVDHIVGVVAVMTQGVQTVFKFGKDGLIGEVFGDAPQARGALWDGKAVDWRALSARVVDGVIKLIVEVHLGDGYRADIQRSWNADAPTAMKPARPDSGGRILVHDELDRVVLLINRGATVTAEISADEGRDISPSAIRLYPFAVGSDLTVDGTGLTWNGVFYPPGAALRIERTMDHAENH